MSPLRTLGSASKHRRSTLRPMRRLLALAAAAGIVLATAPAAFAESTDRFDVNWPDPANGEVVSGDTTAHFSISAKNPWFNGIQRWQLEIVQGDSAKPLCARDYGDQGSSTDNVDVNFKWDTTRYPDSATGCDNGSTVPSSGSLTPNGAYTLKLTVTNTGPVPGSQADPPFTRTFTVDNAPTTPGGVKLAYDKADDQMTVTWSASPEPDISGYKVQECTTDGSACQTDDWKTVGETAATKRNLALKRSEPGEYSYRVASSRLSSSGTDRWSVWSSKSDPSKIAIEAPATTTTSTTAPAQGGGSTTSTTQAPAIVQRSAPPEVKPAQVQRPTPRVVQNTVIEDHGYTDQLPYPKGDPQASASTQPITVGRQVAEIGGDGEESRGYLIPMAGGALLVVFAFQVRYLNRRAVQALEALDVDEGRTPLG